ncbi:hypothetical protein BC332_26165 [Capsicum chinense]|nr:hypothetical protein BC332_26165 [Capsicum chinense]
MAEEFSNFNTILPQKFLIKVGLAFPVSPEQSSKRKKTVIFQEDSPVVMDDDKSTRARPVCYVSGLYSETQKDAIDKREFEPEGTSKLSLDSDEIKNYINKCVAEKMNELVTLISKILVDVVKALKKEENKKSQAVNGVDKDEGRDEDLKKQHCSDLKALQETNGQPLSSKCFRIRLFSVGLCRCTTSVQKLILLDVEMQHMLEQRGNCGIFVSAYAEILSKGQQVYTCGFDPESQRARYALLLWHYGVTKSKEGYTSDNDDPPRLKNCVLQTFDESTIVTFE